MHVLRRHDTYPLQSTVRSVHRADPGALPSAWDHATASAICNMFRKFLLP